MSIQLNWLLDKQVIHVELSGDVSANELYTVGESVLAMVESAQVPLVHVVCDETRLGKIPTSLPQLSGAMQWLQHPKFGWMLCFGAQDRMTTFLAQGIASLFKLRYRRFNSEDDALDFLASIDTSFRAVV